MCVEAKVRRVEDSKRAWQSKLVRCVHCRRKRQRKCRGLCSTCWRDESIRDRFPPTKVYHRRIPEEITDVKERPLPKKPTTVFPGAGKIDVLAQRFARGEALFHPGDARTDLE